MLEPVAALSARRGGRFPIVGAAAHQRADVCREGGADFYATLVAIVRQG